MASLQRRIELAKLSFKVLMGTACIMAVATLLLMVEVFGSPPPGWTWHALGVPILPFTGAAVFARIYASKLKKAEKETQTG